MPPPITLFKDFEQIVTGAGVEGLEAEVVENEEIGAAEGFDQARMAPVASGERHVLAEFWPAMIEDGLDARSIRFGQPPDQGRLSAVESGGRCMTPARPPRPSSHVVEGMQPDLGYLSPYFITSAEKMVAEARDAHILIHEKKLSSLQLLPILEAVVQIGKPLLLSWRTLSDEDIVPGGGVALLRAKAAIGKLSDENAGIQVGINIRLGLIVGGIDD